MSFNRNFPNQKAFKRFSKLELVKLVQSKEREGWEMVKPIYEERVLDKTFKYRPDNKLPWKFKTDTEIVKYVAVMKKIGA